MPSFEVSEDTNMRREQAREQAMLEAVRHASFPAEVVIQARHADVPIPLAKWGELEALRVPNLRQRAMNLKDTLDSTGARFFEHFPHLSYKPAPAETLCHWIIAVQVKVCQQLGYDFDAQSFGAPGNNLWDVDVPTRAPTTKAPCWSQYDLENRSNSNRAQAQPVACKAPFANDFHSDEQPARPHTAVKAPYAADYHAPHQQRQQQPADDRATYAANYQSRPTTAQSRFDDASHIRMKNSQSQFTFA